MRTHAHILYLLLRVMPLPEQIRSVIGFTEPEAFRFSWRGDTFRVSLDGLMVEQVEDGILSSNSLALVIESAIRQEDKRMIDRVGTVKG